MIALRAMFSTASMRALWEDDAIYRAMLLFESALATAQAECGVIPSAAARAIVQGCESPQRFNWLSLTADARVAGTAAIPFAKALRQFTAKHAPNHAAFVHYGSTSQDVCDTALVLQAQQALDIVRLHMRRLGDALATQIAQHRLTPMLGRTLMQPATPISFGWKAAGWLDMLSRCALALHEAGEAARVIQFGGANGARAAFVEQSDAIAAAVAKALGVSVTTVSWHSARDRLARLGNEMAVCCATLGKIGRDISLMMQSEVAEAFEPAAEGRGGSSAMPHKRNPVGCMHMLDAAIRAPGLASSLMADMVAEHERGLGSWPNALPLLADLFLLLDNSLTMAVDTVEGLRVDSDAMRSNMERLRGVAYAQADLDAALRACDTQCARVLAAWQAQRAALTRT